MLEKHEDRIGELHTEDIPAAEQVHLAYDEDGNLSLIFENAGVGKIRLTLKQYEFQRFVMQLHDEVFPEVQ